MDRPTRKPGFTLVELLIVLSILVVLMGLLIPTVSKVMELAYKARTRRMMQDIEAALSAFRDAFGNYPPSTPRRASDPSSGVMESGPANLVYYLQGPGGGGWGMANGGAMPFGGRPRKSYPPLIQPDASMLVYENNRLAGMVDAFPEAGIVRGQTTGRILYFRANATNPVFDVRDLGNYDGTDAIEGYASQTHMDFSCGIDQASGTVIREPYLLVSPGVDRRYGYIREDDTGSDVEWVPATEDDEDKKCDDITNR